MSAHTSLLTVAFAFVFVFRLTLRSSRLCYAGMTLTALLTPDLSGGYVAFNPETGSTTQGESIAEALQNLREATELFLEEFPLESAGRPLLTTFEVQAA